MQLHLSLQQSASTPRPSFCPRTPCFLCRIPHTTAYTGAFQDSKQIYIVMEHCKGGDLLEQLLKEGRAMPEKRVVREVVLPTLTALAHLHAAGIIHR